MRLNFSPTFRRILEKNSGERSFTFAFLSIYALSSFLIVFFGLFRFYRNAYQDLDYDEKEYWIISDELFSGSISDPGRRTLGFPLIIAIFKLITSNFLFIQIAVSLLAATAAPLLMLCVYRISRSYWASVLSGIGLSLWPPQIFLASSLYSEALSLPVFLLALYFLPTKISDFSTFKQCILSGIILGITSHVRSMYQLFIPFVFLIILFQTRNIIGAFKAWILIIMGFFLIVLPWSFYISNKLDHPILLTANGGETFAGGFTPALLRVDGQTIRSKSRAAGVGPGKWVPATDTGYLTESEKRLPYVEQNSILTHRALIWILSNPLDAGYLIFRKLVYMWGFYPLFEGGLVLFLFGKIAAIFLLFTFLYSLSRSSTARAHGSRFFLMPLFVSAVAVISWGSWRFRQPADAAMIAIVAIALTEAAGRSRQTAA
jgi:hypothetical protein